jgi:pilus assembly protein CpaE
MSRSPPTRDWSAAELDGAPYLDAPPPPKAARARAGHAPPPADADEFDWSEPLPVWEDAPNTAAKPAPTRSAAPTKAAAPAKPAPSAPRASAPAPTVAPPQTARQEIDELVEEQSFADQPLPRISIGAFCVRPQVAKLVQAISRDRRMSKTALTVEMGGIDAAIQSLSAQASPNLILLDHTGSPKQILADLDRLAEHVDAGAKCVVIGSINDITLYRELMKRGVSEYLTPPLTPVQLIRSISALFTDPEKPFAGRVTAVIGAKGGVGASTIAQNLAWVLAERYNANTTLLDLDVAFGTAGLQFDQEPEIGAGEALSRVDQIDATFLERTLIKHTEHLALLPAAAMLDRMTDADANAYEHLIQEVRRISPFIVLDLPHLWTSWMRQTIISADDVLIVATPDLACLRNAKNIFDLVRAARPHDSPPAIVLNMTGVPKRPEIPAKEFARALEAEPLATIPFDAAVFGQATNNGEMLLDIAPDGPAALAIHTLARAICGREPAPRKKQSLLDRLPIRKR